MRRLSAANIEVKISVGLSGPQRAEEHIRYENGTDTTKFESKIIGLHLYEHIPRHNAYRPNHIFRFPLQPPKSVQSRASVYTLREVTESSSVITHTESVIRAASRV